MEKSKKRLLLKAAIALVEQKPKLVMEYYRTHIKKHNGYCTFADQTNLKHPCGTAGCFMGWMPFLGVRGLGLKKEDLGEGFFNSGVVDFKSYSERVFKMDFDYIDGVVTDPFEWLFGSGWPNNHTSVLKRVKYYVVNDRPPSWFDHNHVNYNVPKSWKAPTIEQAKKSVGME